MADAKRLLINNSVLRKNHVSGWRRIHAAACSSALVFAPMRPKLGKAIMTGGGEHHHNHHHHHKWHVTTACGLPLSKLSLPLPGDFHGLATHRQHTGAACMGAGCCLAQRRRAGFDVCSAKESWQNRVLWSNCDFSAHFPVVTSASPFDPRCTSHTAAKNSPQWILLLRMSAPNAASALGCSGCHIVGSVHLPIQHVLRRQTRSPASPRTP